MMGIHKSTIMHLWKTYSADANQALNKPAEFFHRHLRGQKRVYLLDDKFKAHVKRIPIVERQSL